MAEIHDPQKLLTLDFYRSTGEGREIDEDIAERAGFGVPIFFSQTLYEALRPDSVTTKYGISTRQNILDTLNLLYHHSRYSERQTIVFETAVPRWSPKEMGFEARGLNIAGTLFTAENDPFVVVCEYEEVRDIVEGELCWEG